MSLVKVYKALIRLVSGGILHSPSDVYVRNSLSSFTLIKLCYTKALEWSSPVPGPEDKSLDIMNTTLLTVSYQHDQAHTHTDAKAETPILQPPEARSWLIGKDPDAGKDWGQKEKGVTEDEMFGWHHRLSGHEFEQALGDSEGQGSLVCCSPWGCKELDTT